MARGTKIKKRVAADGRVSYIALYQAPPGSDVAWPSAGTFSDRDEALMAAARQRIAIADGVYFDPSKGRKLLFGPYAEHFIQTHAIAPSTRSSYMSNFRTHIKPAFGDTPLAEVRHEVLQAFVNGLEAKVSKKTTLNVIRLVSRILTEAHLAGHIAVVPVARVRKPKAPKRVKRVVTVAQYECIRSGVGSWWTPLVEFGIETGCRWGEIIGLRPMDIDWLAGSITLQQTIGLLTKKELEEERKRRPGLVVHDGRWYVQEGTKTDQQVGDNEGPRTVPISNELLTLLEFIITERRVEDRDTIFKTPDGRYPDRATFRQALWVPAVKAANIPAGTAVRFHDLRAAHATWLLSEGRSLRDVMDRMGWTQLETVQKYVGRLPSDKDENLAALARVRGRAPQT